MKERIEIKTNSVSSQNKLVSSEDNFNGRNLSVSARLGFLKKYRSGLYDSSKSIMNSNSPNTAVSRVINKNNVNKKAYSKKSLPVNRGKIIDRFGKWCIDRMKNFKNENEPEEIIYDSELSDSLIFNQPVLRGYKVRKRAWKQTEQVYSSKYSVYISSFNFVLVLFNFKFCHSIDES